MQLSIESHIFMIMNNDPNSTNLFPKKTKWCRVYIGSYGKDVRILLSLFLFHQNLF